LQAKNCAHEVEEWSQFFKERAEALLSLRDGNGEATEEAVGAAENAWLAERQLREMQACQQTWERFIDYNDGGWHAQGTDLT
jgi:hypothetical protein